MHVSIPITALSPSDRLFLWAIRAWVLALRRRLDVIEPLRGVFDKYGIAGAAELVDALMSIVACSALRPLAVSCICGPELSEDESRLLAACALHQERRGFDACFLLREILTGPGSRDAGEILERVGALLATGGHALSSWTMQTGRFGFDLAPALPDSGMRPTLH